MARKIHRMTSLFFSLNYFSRHECLRQHCILRRCMQFLQWHHQLADGSQHTSESLVFISSGQHCKAFVAARNAGRSFFYRLSSKGTHLYQIDGGSFHLQRHGLVWRLSSPVSSSALFCARWSLQLGRTKPLQMVWQVGCLPCPHRC